MSREPPSRLYEGLKCFDERKIELAPKQCVSAVGEQTFGFEAAAERSRDDVRPGIILGRDRVAGEDAGRCGHRYEELSLLGAMDEACNDYRPGGLRLERPGEIVDRHVAFKLRPARHPARLCAVWPSARRRASVRRFLAEI